VSLTTEKIKEVIPGATDVPAPREPREPQDSRRAEILEHLTNADLLGRADEAVVTATAAAAAAGESAEPNILICNSSHWCIIVEPL
jgi:hypothetical protein